MTTIAYRDGYFAADTLSTESVDGGGEWKVRACKLFAGKENGEPFIIATAGENGPGLLFVQWYTGGRTDDGARDALRESDADFTCIVLTRKGLFAYDKWCVPERVLDEFSAFGTGAKAALGAMHAGANATDAVAIAGKVDSYTEAPIHTLRLEDVSNADFS